MTKVFIIQALCPARHCILASAYEADAQTHPDHAIDPIAQLDGKIKKLVADKDMNPRCGICAADWSEWSYHVGETRFTSLTAALPALAAEERRQVEVMQKVRQAKLN